MLKTLFLYLALSNIYKKSKVVYMANRFSSSPYFDNTYDDAINIFDYKTADDILAIEYIMPQPIEIIEQINRMI